MISSCDKLHPLETVMVMCTDLKPFAPGDFAEKSVLKLVDWFSGHCCSVESLNLPQSHLHIVHALRDLLIQMQSLSV